jgi:hypothetical protein
MAIQKTTTQFFGLRQRIQKEYAGYEEAISIVKDPRGFLLIKTVEILSPDRIKITEYWRNSNTKELKTLFIPQASSILEKESINQAHIHSPDSHILDKLIGIKNWSWSP